MVRSNGIDLSHSDDGYLVNVIEVTRVFALLFSVQVVLFNNRLPWGVVVVVWLIATNLCVCVSLTFAECVCNPKPINPHVPGVFRAAAGFLYLLPVFETAIVSAGIIPLALGIVARQYLAKRQASHLSSDGMYKWSLRTMLAVIYFVACNVWLWNNMCNIYPSN
jgi:hypothetical protein